MSENPQIAAGRTGLPPITDRSAAVRAIARVVLAGVLLVTLALGLLGEIGWVEVAFFGVAAAALYLIVTGVQSSSEQ